MYIQFGTLNTQLEGKLIKTGNSKNDSIAVVLLCYCCSIAVVIAQRQAHARIAADEPQSQMLIICIR